MKKNPLNRFIVIVFLAFLVLLLESCQSASIRFYNRSSDQYELFIDGQNQGLLGAGNYRDYSLTPGYHKFRVVQNENFVLFPTIFTKQASLNAGQDFSFTWSNILLPSY